MSELCDAYLSLSEEGREVLLLVAIKGLRHEEAAAIFGVPLGTVRSRLSQGRQALRQALEAGHAARSALETLFRADWERSAFRSHRSAALTAESYRRARIVVEHVLAPELAAPLTLLAARYA